MILRLGSLLLHSHLLLWGSKRLRIRAVRNSPIGKTRSR